MTELKLNDFEGFNKILFGDHEPDWSKFYNKEIDVFMPPIGNPITLPEYQLDHYTMWMVISAFALIYKPNYFFNNTKPYSRCYACEYKHHHRPPEYCRFTCPLDLDGAYFGCGPLYIRYCGLTSGKNLDDPERVTLIKQTAEKIAKLKWREIRSSSHFLSRLRKYYRYSNEEGETEDT